MVEAVKRKRESDGSLRHGSRHEQKSHERASYRSFMADIFSLKVLSGDPACRESRKAQRPVHNFFAVSNHQRVHNGFQYIHAE